MPGKKSNGNDVGIKQDRAVEVEKLPGTPQLCVHNSRWGEQVGLKLSSLHFGICPKDDNEPCREVT